MILTRLIYASKVTPDTTGEDIQQIMDAANKNNKGQGLTGGLIYSHKYFLQLIEGSRESVNRLYQKILRDERHSDPQIISYNEITARDYSEWDMRLFLETNINRQFNFKYSTSDNFDPYQMNKDSVLAFFKEIKENYKSDKESA